MFPRPKKVLNDFKFSVLFLKFIRFSFSSQNSEYTHQIIYFIVTVQYLHSGTVATE